MAQTYPFKVAPTEVLSPLFNLVKGDADLPSPRKLDAEAPEALQLVTNKVRPLLYPEAKQSYH